MAGEDEADCPHSGCGAGNISASGSCFFLAWSVGHSASWKDASTGCRQLGGQLATLGTEEKWNVVTQALRQKKELVHGVYVGLTTAPSSLPSM